MRAIVIAASILVPGCGSADMDYVDHNDELLQFAKAFEDAEARLLAGGTCDHSELQRGWLKSTREMQEPTFIIYCGGNTGADRVYLNAESGKLYRPQAAIPTPAEADSLQGFPRG